jgi:hypothetical protein
MAIAMAITAVPALGIKQGTLDEVFAFRRTNRVVDSFGFDLLVLALAELSVGMTMTSFHELRGCGCIVLQNSFEREHWRAEIDWQRACAPPRKQE